MATSLYSSLEHARSIFYIQIITQRYISKYTNEEGNGISKCYILGPLRVVEEYILRIIPSMKQVQSSVGNLIVKSITTKLRIYIVIVVFILLPRFIVAVCLMVDVMVHNSISCMYTVIRVLIIPILFNVVVEWLNIKHRAVNKP